MKATRTSPEPVASVAAQAGTVADDDCLRLAMCVYGGVPGLAPQVAVAMRICVAAPPGRHEGERLCREQGQRYDITMKALEALYRGNCLEANGARMPAAEQVRHAAGRNLDELIRMGIRYASTMLAPVASLARHLATYDASELSALQRAVAGQTATIADRLADPDWLRREDPSPHVYPDTLVLWPTNHPCTNVRVATYAERLVDDPQHMDFWAGLLARSTSHPDGTER